MAEFDRQVKGPAVSAVERVRLLRAPATDRWQTAITQAVAIAAALGLLVLIQRFAMALALLFLGIGVGQALVVPIDWLARRMPRLLAVVLVYLVLTAAVVVLLWLTLTPLYAEGTGLARSAPELLNRLQGWVNHLLPGSPNLAGQLQGPIHSLSGVVFRLPFAVASALLDVVIVVFFSIYWVLSAPAIHNFAMSLVPPHLKGQAKDVFDELGGMVGGYFLADVLDALLIGAAAYVGMRVIGVRFALVIGLVTFVGDLIPLVGPTVAQFLATAIALTQSPLQAVITLVFFLVLEQIDGNITQPAIARGAARIPPLLILFGLVSGGLVGGVLGAIIAIPLFGAVRIVVVRVVAPILRTWWGAAPARG